MPLTYKKNSQDGLPLIGIRHHQHDLTRLLWREQIQFRIFPDRMSLGTSATPSLETKSGKAKVSAQKLGYRRKPGKGKDITV